uniref:Cytoskeleton associated protein 2 n=1 Tax=Nannospalax galili TaxID=1026970 RepID=A0A8C6QIF8_NANGA
MSTSTVPRDLQLPPTQRTQPAFREQRKQKLKEHLLRGKTMFAFEQENQIARGQKVMTSEDQFQEGKKVLKLKTKMADKENIERPTENCSPLKPTNELTTSEVHNFEDDQSMQLLPIKNDFQSQNMTLSQAFHLKNTNKKKQVTAEKPKQDANMPPKPVLGCYRGQIVQSKINSFRKPPQVKNENSATTEKPLTTTFSKATKPVNTSSVRAPNMTAVTKSISNKSVSTALKSTLVQPPVRSHNNTQGTMKRGLSRTSASVTIRKGPHEKELLRSKTTSSIIKTSSSQDIKRNKALSKGIPEAVASTDSSSNTKLVEKSKTVDQRRYTIARATIDKSFQPKETTEERKARLNDWRASKGRILKRPPNSIVAQPEPEGQNEKPVGSFWTTMAEEDEQRLFTEKVNKTFSECLNLINKGCPKEEILGTLNDLIQNIPDAKKLVKYWICLVRIEPITSPIENIISIYEKAILAGAQPIEEMRHTIVDILTMKSQEKATLGEITEAAHSTKEHIQEVKVEDRSVHLESGMPEVENEYHKNTLIEECENNQDNKTKDAASDIATPDSGTGAGCIIKYNVSSTPCLQSMKKMRHDKINSTFKELKFLTPVRRSQRIQDKMCQLPDMLKDHYPSVSSLEQLSELGGDAFVCRPNTALCSMFAETDKTGEK